MSNSRFVRDRFEARNVRRKIVASIYIVATLAYLIWRATIINPNTLTLSYGYFFAETLGVILGLTLIFSSWTYRHREPLPAPPGLRVDVFVTTYKEPVEIVRWTLIAAKEIGYPHNTLVLDDGNRADIKALAEELGIKYLTRGKNLHAKAGNLNFGLANSSADFVMTFDADHVAQPHALDVMLGFFADPRVAMVQTPQDYYNIDAFPYINARNGALWNDQSFFYQIAQSCQDNFNGAYCVGTSVVYRRAALDAIGGIPVDTVTEDVHTSLKLQKLGYENVYLNEPVAYGVAAADLREYYKTRHRWAHGNIHVLRLENILFCKGLTLGQRLSYLSIWANYLEGWQQLLLFVVPWMSLFLGWAPFNITIFNVLVVLLFPLLATLLLQELGCGLSRFWVNEIFSVARFPVHIVAWLGLFVGRMPFRTSVKHLNGRIEWGLMAPQVIVFVVSLAALVTGIVHLALDFRIGPLGFAFARMASGEFRGIDWNAPLTQGYTLELVMVAGFWALFNAMKAACLILKAIRDSRRSTEDYRFEIRLALELADGHHKRIARVNRISRTWLSARGFVMTPHVGGHVTGTLYLPTGPLPVDLVVRRVADDLSFEADISLRKEDEARLMRNLYTVDWHREMIHRHAYFSTPLDYVDRLLRRTQVAEVRAEWHPALFSDPETGQRALCAVSQAGPAALARVLTFRKLTAGETVDAIILGERGMQTRHFQITGDDAKATLTKRGLNGADFYIYRAVEAQEKVIPAEKLAVEFAAEAAE